MNLHTPVRGKESLCTALARESANARLPDPLLVDSLSDMDWFVWVMFGAALLLLAARVLVGPSDPIPDTEDEEADNETGP